MMGGHVLRALQPPSTFQVVALLPLINVKQPHNSLQSSEYLSLGCEVLTAPQSLIRYC